MIVGIIIYATIIIFRLFLFTKKGIYNTIRRSNLIRKIDYMKKNRFIEGTLFAYIMILITKVIGAVYIIPFRAIIGEEGGNLYGYAYQVYNLFLDISTSGIPTAISIIIAEYNALKMFNEREYAFKIANRLVTGISIFAFLVMFVLAEPIAHFYLNGINEANIPSVVMVIRVISFCILVIPFLSITRGYLQGNRYTKSPWWLSLLIFNNIKLEISPLLIFILAISESYNS